METTLIGVFNDIREAEQARERLPTLGIGNDMIRLATSDELLQRPAESKAQRGFFSRLFGLDESDEYLGHYSEALRRGSALLSVHLIDDSKLDQVKRLLEEAGAVDIDQRVEQWRKEGYRDYVPQAAPFDAEQAARERETFKVMREQLKVGKRAVKGGGVRIHPRLVEKPVTEQVTLREERAVVDRRPVDRPATPEELEAFASDKQPLEVREMSEEAVVSKTARVVEEVSVGKEAKERTETINETLRGTDVDIQELDSEHERQADIEADAHVGRKPAPPRRGDQPTPRR